MASKRASDELYVTQVKIFTDAGGREIQPREERQYEIPQRTGNMNYKGDNITFYLDFPLALTRDGATTGGIRTYVTYKIGKTKTKVQTVFTNREAVVTAFDMGNLRMTGCMPILQPLLNKVRRKSCSLLHNKSETNATLSEARKK